MSWRVEYGRAGKKHPAGRLLRVMIGAVLVATVLVLLRPQLREAGQAVEAMAVNLRAGMPLGAAAQTFCQEVFLDGG